MSLATTLLAMSAMLVLGLLSRLLCDRLHLPYSVSMLLIGFVGSEFIVAMGYDTGIRAELLSNIVFYGLLPVLIVESAFHIDAARALGILMFSPLLNLGKPRWLSWRDRGILAWDALRGAVTLALALSIPVSLDYWWTIQSIAFGVVAFSLFAQAPSMRWLAYEPGT